MDQSQRGRPLAIDHKAASTSPTEPAFIARPEGAAVYHGFVILDDIAIEGFTLGKITDWEAEPCDTGDAFVIVPDGSRAGIVWEVSDPAYFEEIMPMEAARWGVWGVGFLLPMASRENARKNLESILPQLKSQWAEWNSQFNRNNR
jgi:hypothetical protein